MKVKAEIRGNVQKVWVGKLIKCFPAGYPVQPEDVYKYYGIEEDHRHFKVVSSICKVNRFVLERSDGHYSVVPDNPLKTRYLKITVLEEDA